MRWRLCVAVTAQFYGRFDVTSELTLPDFCRRLSSVLRQRALCWRRGSRPRIRSPSTNSSRKRLFDCFVSALWLCGAKWFVLVSYRCLEHSLTNASCCHESTVVIVFMHSHSHVSPSHLLHTLSCPMRKIRIPMASLEESHNLKRVEEDRSIAIEAAIVRIMKVGVCVGVECLIVGVIR